VVPFSKYEPNRPVEPRPEGTTPSAIRRIRILKWANWIVLLYTALGFGLIAYWLLR
jgi:hypothetical protein